MKTFILSLVLFFTISGFANEACVTTEAQDLYLYQDRILSLAKKATSAERLKADMQQPLRCLVETYKDSDDLLTKYVAGACLQRLMGGPEVKGFNRNKAHDVVYQSLINQQLEQSALLTKSEIADFAQGKWQEYIDFCKGSVTELLCSELLPSNDRIQLQNEMLGATSMLVLKSAYHQFSGETKKKIHQQITKLYRETSKNSPLKRRVIDQIYQEINKTPLELRGS
ncbi:MAG: hypothetical protein OM95_00655 [Bdellovibrio sp. ArHS]|uniref:hypothetical protein n=1 Tax=Bdellovibrio sp. ArHS TaxID=1569284 RepID=UPI0005838E18|nr:hypothetical protein [Bdellovibrio sp. ArHS]KHD90063.1 MAG: hypothetical protein OM95_00655 [Bdellovibrio sp. ArHS]